MVGRVHVKSKTPGVSCRVYTRAQRRQVTVTVHGVFVVSSRDFSPRITGDAEGLAVAFAVDFYP